MIVTQTAMVNFDGTHCHYDGPTDLVPGDILHVRFTNTSGRTAEFGIWTADTEDVIEVPTAPGTTNEGYGRSSAGSHESSCVTFSDLSNVPGPVYSVA